MARMHNSIVGRALEELWSARAGTLTPVTMNEVLRGIQPYRDIIEVGEPGGERLAHEELKLSVLREKSSSGTAAAPTRGQQRVVCPLPRNARTMEGKTRPSSWKVESRPHDKCSPGCFDGHGPARRMPHQTVHESLSFDLP